MMKKFAIFILVFVVLALVYSYHQARQNALGEALVSNAYYGDLIAVKENLEEGAPLSHVLYFDDEDRQYTGVEFNALQAAASSGNEDLLNFLIDQGLPVDTPTPNGWTPLFIAARDGRAEAAKLLLFRGADVNARTDQNATPLTMVLTQKFPTEKERLSLLEYILKRGANLALQDAYGHTPLYYALHTQNPEALRLLLEYGAQPDAESRRVLAQTALRSDTRSQKITALFKKKAVQ